MKRSEMVCLLREKTLGYLPIGTLRDLLQSMDACQQWDPEEPEEALPDQIVAAREGACKGLLAVRAAGIARLLTMAEALEAERRWNAWKEVWKVQRAMEDHEDWALIRGFADQLRAILGGAQPATRGTYHNSREQRLEDAVGALWLELQCRVYQQRGGRTMSSLEAQVRAALDRDRERA